MMANGSEYQMGVELWTYQMMDVMDILKMKGKLKAKTVTVRKR